MIHLTIIDWLIFLGTPIAAWCFGLLGRGRRGGWRGYFLASGMLPTSSVVATYVGANVTFTAIFLLLAAESRENGPWVFVIPVFWVIGTLVFLLCYKRLKPYFNNGQTIHQALGTTFESPALQKWASVWTIVAFVGTVALEFYGGVLLAKWSGVPGLEPWTVAMIFAFVCSWFTFTGGLRGLAIANRFLDIMTFAGTAILGYFAIRLFPGNLSTSVATTLPTPSGLGSTADKSIYIASMAALFIPFQICALDSWQRCGAWAKRANTTFPRWLFWSGIAVAIVYCVPILIGWLGPHGDTAHPLKSFLDTLHLHDLPVVGIFFTGIVFAGFIAAIFSTADELLNCAAFTMLFDLLGSPRELDNSSELVQQRINLSGRLYTALFGFLAATLAFIGLLSERALSDLAVAVFSGQIVFIGPLCFVLRGGTYPEYRKPAIAAMLLSFIADIGLVGASWISGDPLLAKAAPLAALFVSILVLVGSVCVMQLIKAVTKWWNKWRSSRSTSP